MPTDFVLSNSSDAGQKAEVTADRERKYGDRRFRWEVFLITAPAVLSGFDFQSSAQSQRPR